VAAVVGFAGLTIAVACTSSSSDALTRAELAEGCLLNSDCTSPLVCAFKTCHIACQSSRDCQPVPDTRCVESDKPFHVCLNTAETSCVRNSDCPGAEICGVDLQCRDQCVTDRDCLDGQTCAGGVCADEDELEGGGLPDRLDAGSVPTCVHASDCPGVYVCIHGSCGVECVTAKDCPVTWSCLQTRCAPPGYDAGQGDAAPNDAGGG
jgi:hypothetical protein